MWKHIEVGAENVKIGALCGRGSYAEVYEGRAFGGVACAVKVYLNTASAKQLKGAMREIKLGGALLLAGLACLLSVPLSTLLDAPDSPQPCSVQPRSITRILYVYWAGYALLCKRLQSFVREI